MLAVSEVYEQFLPLKKILPRKVWNAAAWEKFSKNKAFKGVDPMLGFDLQQFVGFHKHMMRVWPPCLPSPLHLQAA